MTDLTKAAADVLAERERQKAVEGWTPEHDDKHGDGELSCAAACYAAGDPDLVSNGRQIWPWWDSNRTGRGPAWLRAWWKPADRRRDLVKAGALILAEIERLDRKGTPGE